MAVTGMNVLSVFRVGIKSHCDQELVSKGTGRVNRVLGVAAALFAFPGIGLVFGGLSGEWPAVSAWLEAAVGLAIGFPMFVIVLRGLAIRDVACPHGVWMHRFFKHKFVPWSEVATIGPPPGRFGPRGVVTTEGAFYRFLSTTNVGDFGWRDLYADLNRLLESSRAAPDGLARMDSNGAGG